MTIAFLQTLVLYSATDYDKLPNLHRDYITQVHTQSASITIRPSAFLNYSGSEGEVA